MSRLSMIPAKLVVSTLVAALSGGLPSISVNDAQLPSPMTYLGFDRNDYPGDSNLKPLRQTFSYTGYWLNNPPGASADTWAGHRAAVEAAGFGFLVLFNGRLYAQLKSVENAKQLGESDGRTAVTAARREGFLTGTIIFLDQEQGGRMLPEQKAYIYAWVDAVVAAGFRAGIYCSGISAKDDANVVTAEDIRADAGSRQITYWAINDACPPSPGCSSALRPPPPSESGVRFAEVWQFAQSPRRADVAAHCTNYSRDRNCYPPGMPASAGLHVDLNSATSADPSHGRTR
ncbi:MAG TPA: glycoside hydrolase domain-containing protein [Candidatus Sulfotelmatobacter sp.]|nr:glycoside hydrolase domain-containing protein [Candidatus Sulfotelmatobacter sp.]